VLRLAKWLWRGMGSDESVGPESALTSLRSCQENLVHKASQSTWFVSSKILRVASSPTLPMDSRSFLKSRGWCAGKECKLHKLEARRELVHRLTDCAECAKVHVNVPEDMLHAGSEDLRGTDVSRTLEIKRLDWPMYWRSCSFIVAKAIARRRKHCNNG
jgi:hypothetical protein